MLLTSSCGSNSGHAFCSPIPIIALSWTESFIQGTQSGPITFPSVGEPSVIMIATDDLSNAPFQVSSGPCVTLSAMTVTTSVTVTAATLGSCVISVTHGGITTELNVNVE